jgi:hypothetical protein
MGDVVLQGPPGADGKHGRHGRDGRPGDRGIPGPSGPSGPPGADGRNGLNGKDGQTIQGPPGPQGPAGKDGQDGKDGIDGQNGRDGIDGKDGRNGKDGISVREAVLKADDLIIVLSDGREINVGRVKGKDGKNGLHGSSAEGEPGAPGAAGAAGADGSPGADGLILSPTLPAFIAQTDVGLNGAIISAAITVSGDSSTIWPATVRGSGSPTMDVNADADWKIDRHIKSGDQVRVNVTAAGTATTERIGTLYAQGASSAFSVTTGVTYDAASDAFFVATGITDDTQQSAIDALVIGLKNNSIWTKFKAIYPFVGGSAGTHKYNLKDPRDLDAAYRLTFSGSWTHNANGITGDGSTAYADTHFVCSTAFTSTSSASLGIYCRTQATNGSAPYDMAAAGPGDTNTVCCISRYSNNSAFFALGTTSFAVSVASSDARGLFAAVRDNGTTTKGYKNGSSIVSGTDAAVFPAYSIYIGACNRQGTTSYFSDKNWALAFIADALTSGEMSTLYSLVQTFQTALSRNV